MKRSFRTKAGMSHEKGLSLIELMIALLLGSILTIGLTQVFTSNSQSFRHNEASARVLESGRIATDILGRALRNAGFFGCFPINGISNNLDSSDGEYSAVLHSFNTMGVSATDTGTYSERPSGAISGTDFINITGVRRPGAIIKLDADLTDTSDIELTGKGGLTAHELMFITNCEQGDLFEISSLSKSGGVIKVVADNKAGVTSSGHPGNDFSGNAPPGCTGTNQCLSTIYNQGTEIFQPYSEAFYIGNSTGGGRSLFMRQSDGTNIEMVAGVEDMQVRFGEGTVPTGVQNWRVASAVANWDDVLAVEVSLLVASPNDNVMDSAQSYCFPGWEDCVADSSKLQTAGDDRMYRVYTFTSSLRNPF